MLRIVSRPGRFFLAALIAQGCGTALAQTPGDPPDQQKPVVWQPTSARIIELFPAGDIYPVHVADPHRPTNSISEGFYVRNRVPDTRSPRTLLAAGGRFGIVRVGSSAPRGRYWQLGIDAGLDAMFDSQFKNDAIGWDGNYGLTLTTAASTSPLAFKVAVVHLSAHLGDEYEDRTGHARINYTREEVALGGAWRFAPRWRAYGEVGAAYIIRSDTQDRWRWQSGIEYEARPTLLGGRMAWYGASDFSSLEERGWRLDTAVQAGLVARSSGRAYRLFAQWYDGRPAIGQFTSYSEASVSLGLKVDL